MIALVTLSLDLPDNSHFSKYSLYAENDGILVTVNKDIEGGRLLKMLEQARDNESVTGISV